MRKLIISEEEKKQIKSMYGLLIYESTETPITLPHTITIPTWTSSDEDSAHKLEDSQITEHVTPILQQIYDSGKNPKFTNGTMEIIKNGNQFSTNVTLTINESDDGLAYMGLTTRGSIGDDYLNRAWGQITGAGDKNGRSLEWKIKNILSGDNMDTFSHVIDDDIELSQYFVQFTKKEFPPHKKSSQTIINQTSEKKEISIGTDPVKLRDELKTFSKNQPLYDVNINITNQIEITYQTSGSQRIYLSYIYSPDGKLQDVLDKVEMSNVVINKRLLDLDEGIFQGYVVELT